MKNITLSADDDLIEQARRPKEFEALMQRLGHVRAGRHFTREQMNER